MSVEVKVPSVGESVTEVFIGQWRKSAGERVEMDEEIVELESEKATFDAPAPASGTLEKILKQAGETAAIGEVIAYIDDSKNGKTNSSQAKETPSGDAKQEAAPAPEKSTEVKEPPVAERGNQTSVTPSARRLLNEHGLAAGDIHATGPGGRLLKEDVLREIQTPAEKKEEPPRDEKIVSRVEKGEHRLLKSASDEEIVPMSPLRRRIAARLVKAQQEAALLTTFNEVDMSAVMALRKRHQESFQKTYGVKLGFMSFFVKATVDALMHFPEVNAEIRGTDIVYHRHYDIGVAVSTEKGLVVPVLRNAEQLSFAEVEQTINALAEKARDGKLSIDELSGGTFTISNEGVFGSLMSTPIVNPPQCAVLGMHAIQDRPVVREGQIVARPMMYLALSYDHRLIDGREAVSFLRRITETIEEPARLLIEA